MTKSLESLALVPVFNGALGSSHLKVTPKYKFNVIFRQSVSDRFYRAMHFSAKRGIAIACRLSVRTSVRL